MANVTVKVRDNGPFMVEGAIQLQDAEGKTFPTEETTYLCRCGLSGNKPFCDGSHKGKFESAPRAK